MGLFGGAQKEQDKPDVRCPVCLAEYVSAHFKQPFIPQCPFCKTVIPPMPLRHDGWVKLNWQELRVLAIYAQRWSTTFDLRLRGNLEALRVLQNILHELRQYQPKDAPPIVPSMNVVYLEGHHHPHPPKVELDFDPAATMEPDKDGNVPSPYKKKPPQQ